MFPVPKRTIAITWLSMICLCLLFFSSDAQDASISFGDKWKYKDNGSDQGTAWRDTTFDDSAWSSGFAQLGYGDGDEGTIVNACGTPVQFPSCSNKYTTTYFRKKMTVANVNAFTQFQLDLYRDDGIVVYINGHEVYRNNMPAGTILYNTFASGAASDDGTTIQSIILSRAASFMVTGVNTIAAEIHQNAGTSSDLTFDMQLYGTPVTGGALVTRGPYLQKATPTGITVRWRTSASVTSKVTYGTDPVNLSQSVTVSGTRTEHTVTLTGLQPKTKYYYSIGSTTGVMQSGSLNYFVTNPSPGEEGKYTFWVTGDCGNNSNNQIQVRSQYNNYSGDSVTNGWLLLGDNAYSSGTDVEFTTNFFTHYQATIMKHAPLWPVPGNHDYANSSSAQDNHNISYYSIFDLPVSGESGGVASNNEAFYSYDYGNIHFLALDSYGEESNKRIYDTTGAQAIWVKQDLEANQKKWTIAYWHHPPYTMGSHNSDTETELVNIRTNFIRILERYGVDLILCGHSHVYERTRLMKGHYGLEPTFNAATHNLSQSSAKYNGTSNSCPYRKDSVQTSGTVYIVAGSAGQLGGAEDAYPHNAMYFSDTLHGGSLVLQVDGKRLDAKWLCGDGVIRDQFTIFKDAGKKVTINSLAGQNQTLTASWKGNYSWSTSATTQSINVSPTVNSVYLVSDPNNCLKDTFNITIVPPVTITLHILLEGLYAGNESMYPLLKNSGMSEDLTDVDTVTILLYEPSGLSIPFSSASGILKTNGTVMVTFPKPIPSSSYYIVVKHKSSIETWSKTPVYIAGNTSFDFIHY